MGYCHIDNNHYCHIDNNHYCRFDNNHYCRFDNNHYCRFDNNHYCRFDNNPDRRNRPTFFWQCQHFFFDHKTVVLNTRLKHPFVFHMEQFSTVKLLTIWRQIFDDDCEIFHNRNTHIGCDFFHNQIQKNGSSIQKNGSSTI